MLDDFEFGPFQPRIVEVTVFALLPVIFAVVAMPVADQFIAAIPPRDGHPRRTPNRQVDLASAIVLGSVFVPVILINALVVSV